MEVATLRALDVDAVRPRFTVMLLDAFESYPGASVFTPFGRGEIIEIAVVALIGDNEGPWLKVPPFTEDPKIWLPTTTLGTTPYLALPQIDTKQFRLLTLYMTYVVDGESNGQLSIVPEKLALDENGDLQFYETALVDASVTSRTLAAPFNQTLGSGSRNFLPSEFRWPPAATSGPVTLRTMLTFEVSDADAFRINVADVISANVNTFSALYARSQ